MQICAGIHCDANRHTLLLILRLLLEDLMGLLYTFTYGFVFKKHGVEISMVEGARLDCWSSEH